MPKNANAVSKVVYRREQIVLQIVLAGLLTVSHVLALKGWCPSSVSTDISSYTITTTWDLTLLHTHTHTHTHWHGGYKPSDVHAIANTYS